jgi:hypothetical protein
VIVKEPAVASNFGGTVFNPGYCPKPDRIAREIRGTRGALAARRVISNGFTTARPINPAMRIVTLMLAEAAPFANLDFIGEISFAKDEANVPSIAHRHFLRDLTRARCIHKFATRREDEQSSRLRIQTTLSDLR